MATLRPVFRSVLQLLLLLALGCTGSPAPGSSPKAAPAPSLATIAATAPEPAAEKAPPAEGGLRFAVYGDTRTQHEVHRAIVQGVLRSDPTWVLQTGDLVEDGCETGQWSTFDSITQDLRKKAAYFPARGNHDADCSQNYEARVTQPVLSGDKRHYSFERGNLHFVSIDTESDVTPASEQGRWLAADLAQAQAAGRFIIPFFHKAIFSIGQHAADSDVRALQPVLHPVFRRYGVRLVFQGHDHVYYRTVRDGITYVVTGGGGAPLYDDRYPKLGKPGDVFRKAHHFCLVEVRDERLAVTAYLADGAKIESFEVATGK